MEAHLAQLRFQRAQTEKIIDCLEALRAEATPEELLVLDHCVSRMKRVASALSVLRESLGEYTETVADYRHQLSAQLDELEEEIHMLF